METSQILDELANFITTPWFRWFLYFLSIILLIISFSQNIMRYSMVKSWFNMNIKWKYYIIGLLEIFGSFLTFFGLWLTIPFVAPDVLPQYWYVPIFVLLYALYTQITIDAPIITDDGSLNPPPTILLPKKYRIVVAYGVLICDIIIFLQFFIHMGLTDYSKNTILHKFILNRFGGLGGENTFGWVIAWVAILYILDDLHILNEQRNFTACKYKLPSSWDF
jgi:hypothetical protein